MFSFSHLLYGLIAAGIGVAGVKYSFQVVSFTGRQDWIEKYTGQGSTYLVLKILSIFLIMGGILFASGFGNNFMEFIFTPLRNVFSPPGA
jgi:hypothetical protein